MDSTQCEVRGGVWACKECGFAYSMAWRDVIRRLSTASDRWRQAVGRLEPASTDLGVRPGLWSPLPSPVSQAGPWFDRLATSQFEVMQGSRRRERESGSRSPQRGEETGKTPGCMGAVAVQSPQSLPSSEPHPWRCHA